MANRLGTLGIAAGVWAAPAQASADAAAPPPAPMSQQQASSAPPAARSVQVGLRIFGLEVTGGSATGDPGDSMSTRAGPVVFSVGIDPGFKVTDEVFVGGYYTLDPTGAGDNWRVAGACRDSDGDGRDSVYCSGTIQRFGLQGQYHFRPDKTLNPWAGLGFGYEVAHQRIHDYYGPAPGGGYQERIETTTSKGWNIGLSAALDVRLGRVIGFGPYASWTWGWYTSSSTRIDGRTTFDGAIPNTATHSFFGLGFRVVVLP